MKIKKEIIPTIAEIQSLSERAKEEKIRREKIQSKIEERQRKELAKMTIDEIAYQEMLKEVIFRIEIAAENQKTSCSVEIGTRQYQNEGTKRKRESLDKIKILLREMNYQTSWSHDVVDYSHFDQDICDEFKISWDPKINWNKFRD